MTFRRSQVLSSGDVWVFFTVLLAFTLAFIVGVYIRNHLCLPPTTIQEGERTMKINTVNVVIVKNGVVDEMFSFDDTQEGNEAAEEQFLDSCSQHVSNWDEFTPEDKDYCLEEGRCLTGVGSICITHAGGGDGTVLYLNKDAAALVLNDSAVRVHLPEADEEGKASMSALVIAGIAMKLDDQEFIENILLSLDDGMKSVKGEDHDDVND